LSSISCISGMRILSVSITPWRRESQIVAVSQRGH
jgi:hypothetical protein